MGAGHPLEPKTLFYDWIYVHAVRSNFGLADAARHFEGFTDIEFNPDKSFNCQARSVAMFVSLKRGGHLEEACKDLNAFTRCYPKASPKHVQLQIGEGL